MDKLEKELQLFLEKHRVDIKYEIAFPKYQQLPEEAVLALKVLSRYGMKFVVKLEHTNNVSK